MLARLALSGLALALVACRANDLRPAGAPIAPNLRVVDAETGQPVSGAEVFGVHEDTAPLSGELWYRASATTDDDGWAGLAPASDEREYSWRIVRAKGYATSGSTSVPRAGGEPEVVELHRAGEAKLRVVDFLGRPVPNLKLGLCVGCGHTPDVAVAVTDEDGRATFDCVGTRGRDIADVYPVGEGVQMDYLGVHWNAALDGGYEAVVFPGATLRGKLLLANGSPAVGYAVGAPARHRGPWTRTDDEGRFELFGVARHEPMWARVQDPSGENIAFFTGSRFDLERTLRLPEEKLGNTRGERRDSAVLVRVPSPGPDAPGPDEVPCEIWDPRSGWCRTLTVPVGETTRVELPTGSFEVEIGGDGSPYRRTPVGAVETRAGADPPVVECELPPVRSTRLEVSGLGPDPEVLMITAEGPRTRLSFDELTVSGDGTTVTGVIHSFLVPGEPFGLWARTEERGRDWVYLEPREATVGSGLAMYGVSHFSSPSSTRG